MSPRPLRIGLDFDDTLMQTRHALVRLLNARFGTAVSFADCRDYRLSPWSLTDEQFHTFFTENESAIHTQPPLDDLLQILQSWSSQATFYVITGRPECWMPSATAWLAKHHIPCEAVISSPSVGGKGVAAQNCKLDFFIEDHAKFALEIASVGIPVLLLDSPYNQSCTHPLVHRVKDWPEIRQYVASRWLAPGACSSNN